MSMPSSSDGRGDDGGQPPGLQLLLDEHALLARHRAVVRARHRPTSPAGCAEPALRRSPAPAAARVVERGPGPFGGQLVEPGGQPLGQPPGVGEHDGRAVRLDEVEHALLDVRPDRGAPLARRRPAPVRSSVGSPMAGHVLDRHHDLRGRTSSAIGGCTTVTGRPPARNVATSSTGRTVADSPMRCAGLVEQRVQALQGQRQMRAALGRADRVHLVDDHRVDAAQRLPRRRGEQQEQRLGRGDQDVGRAPGEQRGARRPGCRRSASRR